MTDSNKHSYHLLDTVFRWANVELSECLRCKLLSRALFWPQLKWFYWNAQGVTAAHASSHMILHLMQDSARASLPALSDIAEVLSN